MALTLERPASAARLAPEEQAVYEFVVADRPSVDRFVDSLTVTSRHGTREAVAAHLAKTDEALHTVYGRWLAMELVAGRVHTLERSYESVLRSMLSINDEMKAALAEIGEDEESDPTARVTRERLRLSIRVGWTDRELQVLRVSADGSG